VFPAPVVEIVSASGGIPESGHPETREHRTFPFSPSERLFLHPGRAIENSSRYIFQEQASGDAKRKRNGKKYPPSKKQSERNRQYSQNRVASNDARNDLKERGANSDRDDGEKKAPENGNREANPMRRRGTLMHWTPEPTQSTAEKHSIGSDKIPKQVSSGTGLI